jgi:4-amino-4-deoxychorismate lyase
MNQQFWYNGELIEGNSIELAINDPGLLYGATVFTTLRIYHQSLEHPLTHWKAHCNRLLHSLEIFNWPMPNWQRLRQGAEALLPVFPVLRIVIFADGREWINGRFLPEDLIQRQNNGIIGWLAEETLFSRPLANHKTGNYLSAWLALQKAQTLGAKEAILVDNQGNWLESSTGNLWGYQNHIWFTPSLDVGILPGIARLQLLNWLKSQNIAVQENIWHQNFVNNLEIIAYSNSVVEIVPFSQIINYQNNFNLNPNHPALQQLYNYFRL